MSGAGAYTDPVTGRVWLGEFRLEKRLNALMAGKLPLQDLPVIVHERAHHSMSCSGVGVALAALAHRIAKDRLRGAASPEDSQRWVIASTLLRPLFEGLAIFAEHDLFPGESNVVSNALLNVFALFCRKHIKSPLTRTELQHYLNITLKEARSLPVALEAKSNVLEFPFGEPTGYLAGYWAVKRLHHDTRRLCSKLLDADLFYAFAFLWMLEDAELALALVSPPPSLGGSSLDEVALLIQLRFREMLNEGLCSHIDEAERWLVAQPIHDDAVPDIVSQAPLPAFPAFCGWTAEKMETFGHAVGAILGPMRDTWTRRTMFRLGHFDAQVAVEDGLFRVLLGGDTLLCGAALPEVSNGTQPGRVEALQGRNVTNGLLSIHRSEELVAVINYFANTINTEQSVTIVRSAPSSVESEVLQLAFEDLICSKDLPRAYRNNAQEIARIFYASIALQRETPADTVRILRRLSNGGLLVALGGNRRQLRTLARVSLLNSVGQVTLEALSANLGVAQHELLETLEEINKSALQTIETKLVDGLPDLAIALV